MTPQEYMNTTEVLRMLRRLNHSADFESSAPVEAAAPLKEKKPRAPRKKKEPVAFESDDSETDSESGEELGNIKAHFEKEPCEYISPAALAETKTKKEAVKYLESKNCPKVAAIKKGKMLTLESVGQPKDDNPPKPKKVRAKKDSNPPPQEPAKDSTPPPPPKKVRAKKVAPPPTPASLPPSSEPNPPPAKKARTKKDSNPPPQETSKDSNPPSEKKKRPASAYALAVGRHRKAGLSFGDAAKAAKAEIDAAKAK
jgi:hypothetical protein